jgi:rfaE bifunctional protein nucleotidyltransferase chain/domain
VDKSLSTSQAVSLAQELKSKNKSIVLCGGIFDILHVGHTRFLQKAKKEADYLFVLLESDEKARKEKGQERPINSQRERAEVLSSLSSVSYVVNLSDNFKDKDYDELVAKIKPDIIAVTEESGTLFHAKRQAKKTGAKVLGVISRIENRSTTRIAEIISKSF